MHQHEGFVPWWLSRARRSGCGSGAHPGEGHHQHRDHGYSAAPSDEFAGGGFGVRRPLRFLAYKLELDEAQVGELAAVLNELKTERAQSDVDNRRALGLFAEAVEGAAFEDAKGSDAAQLRVKSAERLRDAVLKALRRIHTLLDDEQRKKLAYLIRTGTLTV